MPASNAGLNSHRISIVAILNCLISARARLLRPAFLAGIKPCDVIMHKVYSIQEGGEGGWEVGFTISSHPPIIINDDHLALKNAVYVFGWIDTIEAVIFMHNCVRVQPGTPERGGGGHAPPCPFLRGAKVPF